MLHMVPSADTPHHADAASIDKWVTQQTTLATDVGRACTHHYLPSDQKKQQLKILATLWSWYVKKQKK